MNNKDNSNIDLIDLIIIFSKNKLIILYFLTLSVITSLIYYNFFHSNIYESKISIDINSELFMSNDSYFSYANKDILIDIYKSEFYSESNFLNWSQSAESSNFTKNEFLGIDTNHDTLYRADNTSRIFNFIKVDSSNLLLIKTDVRDKILDIYNYSKFVNNKITNELIDLLNNDLSKFKTSNHNTDLELNFITKNNTTKYIIDNIKIKSAYNISNPTAPIDKSLEFKKLLLFFLFVGLFLSFLFIILKHFYYTKIGKNYN